MGTRSDRSRPHGWYRFLLRFYPAHHRQQFGTAMEAMFDDALREARRYGRPRVVLLLWRTTWDHVRLGALERFEGWFAVFEWNASDWNGVLLEWRRAPRVFRRHPKSALLTVATLAIGIALCAVTFSVVYGTVVRGLPFEDADRLVHFERRSDSSEGSLAVTPHDYEYWREHQSTFEDLAAFVEEVVHLSEDGAYPERYVGVRITANALGLLRVSPALGRWITEQDDVPGAPGVIVLSHRLWRQRFGSDSTIVGHAVRLGGQPVTVIGVMPADFGFPIAEEFWTPLQLDVARFAPGEGRLDVFGRLGSGVSFTQAQAEFARLSKQLARLFPANTGIVAEPKTFNEEYIGAAFTNRMLLLLCGGFIALLVSCLNVASVWLSWSSQRRREFAIRTALGASSGRLLVQLIGEVGSLTAVAAAVGFLLARLGVRVLGVVWTRIPVFDLPHGSDALFWWRLELNAPVVVAVLALAFVTTAFAAALPALHAAGAARQRGIGIGNRSVGERGANRLSRYVIIGQLTLTTGLLVPGALMVTSVRHMNSIGGQLDTRSLVTGRMALGTQRYGTIENQIRFWGAFEDQLRAGGIVGSAIATVLPVQSAPRHELEFAGRGDTLRAGMAVVSSGYFDLFGARPIAGRVFTPADRDGAPAVTLVNESLAASFGEPGTVVGGRIRIGGSAEEPWLTIVGVVPDMWMDGTRNETPAGFYVPLQQAGMGSTDVRFSWRQLLYMNALARSDGDSGFDALRNAASVLDPNLPVYGLTSVDEQVAGALQRYRVYGAFYAGFAGFALMLAVLGLYGLMAFTTTVRAPEIGLRKALGATTGEIVLGVLREGLVLVAAGATLGSLLAVWLGSGVRHLLYDVSAWSPIVLVGVVGILVATAIAASVAPAVRAAHVDPVRTLRTGTE